LTDNDYFNTEDYFFRCGEATHGYFFYPPSLGLRTSLTLALYSLRTDGEFTRELNPSRWPRLKACFRETVQPLPAGPPVLLSLDPLLRDVFLDAYSLCLETSERGADRAWILPYFTFFSKDPLYPFSPRTSSAPLGCWGIHIQGELLAVSRRPLLRGASWLFPAFPPSPSALHLPRTPEKCLKRITRDGWATRCSPSPLCAFLFPPGISSPPESPLKTLDGPLPRRRC